VVSSHEVIWHDLECGLYREDLPLWRELAQASAGGAPILEIGAGTGRVCLDLARQGHELTALERDPVLLAALSERAAGLSVIAVGGDARDFRLPRADFALCLVPMQTVQLMGGSAGRLAFLRDVRAHLRSDGVLACALVEEIEPFDVAAEGITPEPERASHDGVLYSSRPIRVSVDERSIRIVVERRVHPGGEERAFEPAALARITLDRLSAARLQQEAERVGFHPLGVRTIAPTELYTGSVVVMLGA
jgi:SAM-dependent methyltransferase